MVAKATTTADTAEQPKVKKRKLTPDEKKAQATRKAQADARLAPVSADCSYALEHFKVITGLGVAGVRKARHGGLRILRIGRRKFVRGSDWSKFLEQIAQRSESPCVGSKNQ